MGFSLKDIFGKGSTDEYVEIDLNSAEPQEAKIIVKPFMLHFH